MATPGYPNQPNMPQSATAAPPPKPAKRGTSKMVPIVVSAGLAVGTFCGLLFGVGLGDPASASPATGNNVKDTKDTSPDVPVPKGSPTPAKPAAPAAAAATPAAAPAAGSATTAAAAPAAGSAAAPAAGSAAAPAAGSAAAPVAAAGSAAAPAPAAGSAAAPAAGSAAAPVAATPAKPAADLPKKAKVTVELTPAVDGAKVTIDGKAVDGGAADIDLGKDGKKKVKLVVKAAGYKTYEKDYDIDGDVKLSADLQKRAAATPVAGTPAQPASGGNATPPKQNPTPPKQTPKPPKKKPPGGGGLIDI